jgi:hypothetical protein
VRLVRINATGEIVCLCEECDALWKSFDDVGRTPFVDFSCYVSPFGLKGHWSEVTILSDEEPAADAG